MAGDKGWLWGAVTHDSVSGFESAPEPVFALGGASTEEVLAKQRARDAARLGLRRDATYEEALTARENELLAAKARWAELMRGRVAPPVTSGTRDHGEATP